MTSLFSPLWLRSIGRGSRDAKRERLRISTGMLPVYVVGDVHGRFDLLEEIDRKVTAEAGRLGEWPYIVLVGDLIDRGPKSADVLDYVTRRSSRDERFVCLCGNHEALMLDFMDEPRHDHSWIELGGRETLASYGVDLDGLGAREIAAAVRRAIPEEHLDALRAFPIAVETEVAFISHAGVRPGRAFDEQDDKDLLWFRDFMKSDLANSPKLVVHGHEALPTARQLGRRINVDSGAYATGVLTAVRIDRDGSVGFLTTSSNSQQGAPSAARAI